MRLMRNVTILFGFFLVAACSPKASDPQPQQKKVVATAAAPAPGANTVSPPAPAGEEEEHEDERATDEKGMYGFEGEIMPFPPPMGVNGEITHFEPASTTATDFTGRVTFSGIPKTDEPTQWLHMQAENGLAYDLQIVDRGGVDAMAALDWSKIMMQPVGMQDFLNGKDNGAVTVVFVYKVMREYVPRKASKGGLCKKTGYIALTESHALNYINVAAFGPGPWPPKDDSTLCRTFTYGMTDEDAGLQNGMH